MRLLFSDYTGTVPTLAGPITNTATAIAVQAGQGALLPNPGQNQYFVITMIPAATGLPGEIMWCTARSTDTLTVIRGQEGTTSTAYLAGDSVAPQVTAGALSAFAQIPTYAGNPNGFLAGQAGSAEESPDAVWDTVNFKPWICTTGSSNPANAVWTSPSFGTNGSHLYNAAGTFTFTITSPTLLVEGWGAGAGGSGNAASTAGGCGGGGSYGLAILTGLIVGNTITATIGTGGTAGAAGGNNGGNGGTTSFGAYLSCPAGSGGIASSGNLGVGGGSPSGSALIMGIPGGSSAGCGFINSTPVGVAGSAPRGGSGGATTNGGGNPGIWPGGGGGSGMSTTSAEAGGAGAAGGLIIRW